MTDLIILSLFKLHNEALAALLSGQPGIQICAAYVDLEKLKPFTPIDRETTLLFDFPGLEVERIQAIKERIPQVGFLYLIDHYDLSEVIPLLKGGVTGFVSRQERVGDLARAVIAVGRGEIVLPSEIAIQCLLALAQEHSVSGLSPKAGRPNSLSDREVEVLHLLARGMTNKDIAQNLILSVRTVEAHLSNIFLKWL